VSTREEPNPTHEHADEARRSESAPDAPAPDGTGASDDRSDATPHSLEHASQIAQAQRDALMAHLPGSGTGLRLSASVGLIASSAERPGAPKQARETYGVEELAIVLSHYDLGPIDAILEFRRGSRRSPKLLIKSAQGTFLLKRRAPGRDDPERVRLSHEVQRFLAERQFPLPRLIHTEDTDKTALRFAGRTYELFEFIPGTKYDASLPATMEAGRTLALFHKLLAEHEAPREAPAHASSYHGAQSIPEQLDHIGARSEDAALRATCATLREAYQHAAAQADKAGLPSWPRQIVHGDWHPGNTLYRGPKVIAVIDFDSARHEARAMDVANGALQYSITMNGSELESWPDYLDESRFKRFCRGYDAVEGCVISTAELRAVPWLMIEALIVEAVVPIAATGAFAGLEGGAFLRMVERKAGWMRSHASELYDLVTE